MIGALFSPPSTPSPSSSLRKRSQPWLGIYALLDPPGYTRRMDPPEDSSSLGPEPEPEPTKAKEEIPQAPPEPGEFLEFLQDISPTWCWIWPHLLYVQEKLEALTRGEISRLMILKPPRHGKSEQTTVRYPIYRLKRNPKSRICVGAYNQDFANRFGRRAHRLAKDKLNVAQDRHAAKEWETVEGGVYRSCGVGGAPTGEGFDLLIIDDPIKDREEANSEAYRKRVWEWYTDALLTRLEPDGAIILIMTCWHEDDLAGRILSSEEGKDWVVVRMPAEAETQEERDDWCRRNYRPMGQPDPIGRAPGEALCPDRYPKKALRRLATALGRSYFALYQQRPQSLQGAMLQRQWFKLVRAVPKEGMVWIRYYDKAGTEGGGANTAGALLGRTSKGRFIIADVIAAQLGAVEREELIKQTAFLDRQMYGRVKTWVEQEPGSGGKESAEGTIRNLAGFEVEADRVTGNKILRAEPLAAQAKAGNVDILEGPWNSAFLEEAASFPLGKRKDRIDAAGGAFNKLATGPGMWSRHD